MIEAARTLGFAARFITGYIYAPDRDGPTRLGGPPMPGAWSSQRHWHTLAEEFAYVVEGEVVLVTESGDEILRAGDCAGFQAGDADGHHLQNRSDKRAIVLEVGPANVAADESFYPGLDLVATRAAYAHTDGTPY